DEHDGAGAVAERGRKHVARRERRSVRAAAGDTPRRLEGVAAVERQEPYLLVLEPGEAWVCPGDHLGVAANREAHVAERSDVHAPTEPERRREARCLCWPDAPPLGEPVWRAARDGFERALALEQAGGEQACGLTARARAEHE